MYLDYYGLKDPPFSITPDPRFVFLSERHRDALAHLLYGIGQGGSGGFVQLTGEVGTGKTTLSRLLLERLPENTRVALALNPRLSPIELLETICEELKLDIEGRRGSLKGLVDALNTYLLDAYAQGLRVVLIIDEAQNLSVEALEQVRLLTNLETPTQKLLQIILLGQPELRELLGRPELRQLAQRVTARYHLTPLTSEETEAYVRHRLQVAGMHRVPFTRLGMRALHRHSGGVPRLINIVAERALLAGYAQELESINERVIDQAAAEALDLDGRRYIRPLAAASAAVLFGLVVLFFALGPTPEAEEEPVVETTHEEIEPDSPFPLLDDTALAGRIADSNGDEAAQAWTQLMARWQIRAEEVRVRDASRCPPVLAPGIYCMRVAGNLGKLRALRRPVIMRLVDGNFETVALLLGLGQERARIDLGGEVVETPLRTLERFWLGEFFAIWRAPEFLPTVMRRGDTGPGVSWLLERLAQVDNSIDAGRIGPPFYDTLVEERVRRFQLSYGLTPDGIVGPETLLALTAYQQGGPRLTRRVP
jgi:general secretion pathway protein A